MFNVCWLLHIILAAANAPMADSYLSVSHPPGPSLLSVYIVRDYQQTLQWEKVLVCLYILIAASVALPVVLQTWLQSVNVKNSLLEHLKDFRIQTRSSKLKDFAQTSGLELDADVLSKRSLPWYLQSIREVPQQNAWTLPLDKYFQQTSQTQSPGSEDHLMKNEWFRYATFKTFPMESPVMPIRLAKTGFYSTGREDEVTCFSCKVTYSRWREGDVPSEVHRKLSPTCQFLSGNCHSNEPIHEETGAQSGAQATAHVQATDDTAESEPEMDSVDHGSVLVGSLVQQQTALTSARPASRHPMYESEATRLQTFDHWPCPEVQDPGLLATAGFFYAGTGDCVRCYSCGGGLRNWQYGDGAWEEHARWFPRCYFLNQSQSQEFIRRHREENGDYDDGMELPDDTIPADAWQYTENTLTTDETWTPSVPYQPRNHSNQTPATHHNSSELTQHPGKQVHDPPPKGAKALREENEQLRQQLNCKICMNAYVCILLLPCKHLVACAACASKIQHCAVCRATVKGRIRAFLS